ncbi:MAG: hypothetical protein KAW45_05435 [Thermoplasmatales archaeon]|nr:hypothetical protein [Thermoplasmatales archaeon]
MVYPAVNATSLQGDVIEKPLEVNEIGINEYEKETVSYYQGNPVSCEICEPEIGYIYLFLSKSDEPNAALQAAKLSLWIPGDTLFIDICHDGPIARVHFKIVSFFWGDIKEGNDTDQSDGFSYVFTGLPGLRIWSIYVDGYDADDNHVCHDEMVWPSGDGGALTGLIYSWP